MGDPIQSRIYVHRACGGATEIGGSDFSHLVNPLVLCDRTFCASCRKFAGLADVYWADTGEIIADYRKRLRSRTPASMMLVVFLAPVFSAVLGFAAGLPFPRKNPGVPFTLALAAALLQYFFLTPLLIRSFWKFDFRGER